MNPYIVVKPVITEKSLRLANTDNTYVFEVQMTSNKNQIKEAIEKLFEVKVERIRTIVNQRELKRTGKKRMMVKFGKTKKALVTLKSGQSIDLFDISEE
ncbi:50S ribosomal protein L23 [Patescibacteria group bacterium]|nr:50S ribosomal protein L23 [Patescibacteria group bacterium]